VKPPPLHYLILAVSCQVLHAQASSSPQPPPTEPKTPFEWFARASDQMNIRLPGSAPFHMKVTFHAFPGLEYTAKNEKPQIITGEGFYEETWLAPHQWRREVTLGDYHAIEVESDHGRKMRASTDYEPSRVMMLINALLEPIPRNLSSLEYKQDRKAKGWHIDNLTNADASLVRISRGQWTYNSAEFTDSFFFSTHGLLFLRDQDGLKTKWSNAVAFGARIVPARITVTGGERMLLSADVTIAPTGQASQSPGDFELSGASAEPGMTLRPLQPFDVKNPYRLSADPVWEQPNHSAFSIAGVVDRYGAYREAELLLGVNLPPEEELVRLIKQLRKSRFRPAMIDGSPCQLASNWRFVRDDNRDAGPLGNVPH